MKDQVAAVARSVGVNEQRIDRDAEPPHSWRTDRVACQVHLYLRPVGISLSCKHLF